MASKYYARGFTTITPSWPDWMRACEPALDAMVKAGWATAYGHDRAGLMIHLTGLGDQKMEALLEIFNELQDAGLRGKDFFHVWTIANIYTDRPIDPTQLG